MTPRLAQAGQIFIDELAIAGGPETREMSTMHGAHRERPDALESRLTGVAVGMIGIILPAAAISA
jgi:hypothetical protein